MSFDCSGLYPSSMWVKNSIYPKIETGCAFKPQMVNTFVIDFNNLTFYQEVIDSAIFKTNFYK